MARQLRKYRRALRQNQNGFKASTDSRTLFTSSNSLASTPGLLQRLPSKQLDPIQNQDGSFIFILDYDPLP